MAVTPDGIIIISIQVLKDSSVANRQIVLRNAALIERLRGELPGWISREIVDHTDGLGLDCWPLAIVRFRSAKIHDQQDPPGGAVAPEPAESPVVTACVWRVRINADETRPQLVLSAAFCDHAGFRLFAVDADAAEIIRQEVVKYWQEAALAAELIQLTLLDSGELKSWLEKRVKSARNDFVSLAEGELVTKWLSNSFPEGLPPISPVEEQLLFDVDSCSTPTVDQAHRETYQRLRLLIGGQVAVDAAPLPDLDQEAGSWSGNLALFRRPTRFYPGYSLYRLQRTRSPDTPDASAALVKSGYVVAPDGATSGNDNTAAEGGTAESPFAILDGTSSPIHWLNRQLKARLCITHDTALDYLRFFCEFVHGGGEENWSFYILEGADGLRWRNVDSIDPKRRTILREKMQAPFLLNTLDEKSQEQSSTLHCLATVHHGKAVFFALFRVQPSGEIEMRHDHLLLSELPLEPHKWDNKERLFAPPQSDRSQR